MKKQKDSLVQFKQSQIIRINQLITNFAKTQPNVLKYSQVLMLMLDRCILSNKFTLGDFHKYFSLIYDKSGKNALLQQQKVISKDHLITMFNYIAKILYKQDQKYLHRFYNTFLSQKVDTQQNQINHSRVMVFDATNSKLVAEQTIKKISQYEQQLKNVFITYLFENYWSLNKSKRILLTLRQIIIQNKSWSYPSLIHFLKDSQTSPHLLSVEHIQEIMRLIIPNINGKQQQFYSRHILSDGYHKEVQKSQNTTHPGDPGIMFFQFQLLIARMALDSYPKELQKKSEYSMSIVIQRYFNYLMFRKNQQLSKKPLPSIQRKMITMMTEYYKLLQSHTQKDKTKQQQQQKTTPFQQLAKKMNNQIMNASSLDIDFMDCFRNLDKQLPKMPPLPIVQQQCLPPYAKQNAITIGVQPPPQPTEDGDKVKVQKKKQGNKKDQIPPREFKWAQVPTDKLSAEDYLKDIQTKLNFQVKPLSDIERGVIKRQLFPVIIAQTLFPPELPKITAPYIHAATNALIDKNFILAIQNYNKAMNTWKDSPIDFEAVHQLFFQYSKACIYLSAGKYEYALQQFYLCRKYVDTTKLPFSNPDRSLPYYGLGQLFYQMEQYQLSARCFLKAREIRESILGLEHVQTASTFNNLAACFYMLGRSHQALAYIQIAQVVLDTELGQHHQRTMTARNNLKLISHGSFDNKPQYRKFWEVFEQDKFQKKKKSKKQKQTKKK